MNPQASLAVVSLLLLAACAGRANSAANLPSPDAGIPTAHSYDCESGAVITASYPTTNSATVHYNNTTYTMQAAVSASGARYTNSELEWWTKSEGEGAEGSLFNHLADGTTGELIERCTQAE